MEILTIILPYIVSIGTFVAGIFTGRRKKDNDFLQEMQKSIDLLTCKNAELIKQIVELNAEVIALKRENTQLRVEVEELNAKLENVKTITKTK